MRIFVMECIRAIKILTFLSFHVGYACPEGKWVNNGLLSGNWECTPNYDCVDWLWDLYHINNEVSALGIEKCSKKNKSTIIDLVKGNWMLELSRLRVRSEKNEI